MLPCDTRALPSYLRGSAWRHRLTAGLCRWCPSQNRGLQWHTVTSRGLQRECAFFNRSITVTYRDKSLLKPGLFRSIAGNIWMHSISFMNHHRDSVFYEALKIKIKWRTTTTWQLFLIYFNKKSFNRNKEKLNTKCCMLEFALGQNCSPNEKSLKKIPSVM